MEKFLIISYDGDQQQPYFDYALATGRDHAIILIERIRDYAVAVDALTVPELHRLTKRLEESSEADIQAYYARIESER